MFINDDFMLQSQAARELYHKTAAAQPIIDYHCHLDPRELAENRKFETMTQMWLAGDHYKWRAMRAAGVDERYITGEAGDWEKFEKWAQTVPQTMCNPLYHWTHLELSRAFGIDTILKPATARAIYEQANERLRDMSARQIVEKFNVRVICTTDDPADTLEHHKALQGYTACKVLPAWRPDNVVNIEKPTFKAYIERLGASANVEITDLTTLQDALAKRHAHFAEAGCRLSDHGMDTFHAADFTDSALNNILRRVLAGTAPTAADIEVWSSGMLHHLAVMDAERGWAQQFHIGVIRNNNSLMFAAKGADMGCDSIHDLPASQAGHRFLDRLNSEGKLAKTILYNLNPKDSDVLAVMAGTFNDGTAAGKMQYGAAWWFLDHEEGMRRQLSTLASTGLLARFVGMLTDSRSLLSYTRHEYFRRILCDMLGEQVESGRLPDSELETVHTMVADICYNNAKQYFNM